MEAEFVSEIADQTRNLANVHAPITWDVRWKHSKEYKEQVIVVVLTGKFVANGSISMMQLYVSIFYMLLDGTLRLVSFRVLDGY